MPKRTQSFGEPPTQKKQLQSFRRNTVNNSLKEKNEESAFCKVCNSEFYIGLNDITKHISQKHSQLSKQRQVCHL